MADRDERRVAAQKHNALMKGAFSTETAATVAAARIYEEGEGRELDLPEPPFEATETCVTTSFAPEALYREARGKTLVVDPAAFCRPGGAYEDGSFGPEQILCSQSNLYQVLCGIKESFHDANRDYRRGQLFTDRCAYLPEVAFSRGGDVRRADVLAIAEPLRVAAMEAHRSERECDAELANRVEALLRVAAANQCETLILGAFACGRLGYDAGRVAQLFRAWVDAHPGAIGKLVFAVPRAYFDAFDALFAAPVVEEPVARSEGEEEELGWSPEDLPEGVTFR